jgi:hypothetical protein
MYLYNINKIKPYNKKKFNSLSQLTRVLIYPHDSSTLLFQQIIEVLQ